MMYTLDLTLFLSLSIYTHTHTYISIHIHIHTHTHTSARRGGYRCPRDAAWPTLRRTCTHTHKHTHAHTYIHTHTNAHTCTRKRTHTHQRTPWWVKVPARCSVVNSYSQAHVHAHAHAHAHTQTPAHDVMGKGVCQAQQRGLVLLVVFVLLVFSDLCHGNSASIISSNGLFYSSLVKFICLFCYVCAVENLWFVSRLQCASKPL